MTHIKDFEVTIRIKNNQVRERRLEMGMSQPQLAKAVRCSSSLVSAVECMRENPFAHRGGWKPWAKRMAELFGVDPDTLWPKSILDVKQAVAIRRMDAPEFLLSASEGSQVLSLPPSEQAEHDELKAAVKKVLRTLSPREEQTLRMRFGIGGEEEATLREVSDFFGNAGTERSRQVEAKALRKLRHPSRVKVLEAFIEGKRADLPSNVWDQLGIEETLDRQRVLWATSLMKNPIRASRETFAAKVGQLEKKQLQLWNAMCKREDENGRFKGSTDSPEYLDYRATWRAYELVSSELKSWEQRLEIENNRWAYIMSLERAAMRWIRKRLRGENPMTPREAHG